MISPDSAEKAALAQAQRTALRGFLERNLAETDTTLRRQRDEVLQRQFQGRAQILEELLAAMKEAHDR